MAGPLVQDADPLLVLGRDVTGYHWVEMSDADHRSLLELIQTLKGKVMLSGYRSELYDRMLVGWCRHDFDMPNNAAGGTTKRRMTECLWCNFSA